MNKAPFTILAMLLVTGPAAAAKGKKDAPPPVPEPIKCYEMAWGSKQNPEHNPGLGLNAGQAVTLCSGTTDAEKTIRCFAQAWAHPDDGGLGLIAGQAVALCKTNSLE